MSDSSNNLTLLSPITIGANTLNNRVIMAPLTRNRAGEGNVPHDLNVIYYEQRASAGLIISEGTQISAHALGYPATPGIHNDEQVKGWQKVTQAVHAKGGKIFCQLWHCGRVSHTSLLPNGMRPHAPSAIAAEGEAMTYNGPQKFETPHAVSISEIKATIDDYKHAAECAKAAGFDGVEIHAANGYFLDQFLRDGTNHRDDEYGGSLENRTRLLLEVTQAVCDVWGADRVGLRLSPLQPFNDIKDSDPQGTFTYVITALDKFDLAYLHITAMGADNVGAAGPTFDLNTLRPLWHGPYMTNSGYTAASAEAAIQNGEADMVAFGQGFIANPDLVERFAQDAELNTPDPDTFYGGGEHGYIDYPTLQAAQ